MLRNKPNPAEVFGIGGFIRRSGPLSLLTVLTLTLNIYHRKQLQNKHFDKYFKDVSDKQLVEFDAIFQ